MITWSHPNVWCYWPRLELARNQLRWNLKYCDECQIMSRQPTIYLPPPFETRSLASSLLSMLQGSSEVCLIWSLSSSVQFNVMDYQYPMAVFPSPCPNIYTTCNGESLIDDVTLWETSATASLPEVAQTMNSKAQAWECSVCVAGGALNLLKTFYFAVRWKFWKNAQPVIQTVSDNPDIEIHLMQGNAWSHTMPIPQVEATTGKCTLGVCLAPSWSDKTEYAFHLMEATKLRPHLLQAPLNRKSTRKGFTTMIMQKFSYPLGDTCFT
jgi:hypothetical protein